MESKNLEEMNIKIHPSAIVEEGATIEKDVYIGPFCYVEKSVTLKKGVFIHSNAQILGKTTLHENVKVFQFATVGGFSNDLKYLPEEATTTEIGKNTVIKEYANIHAGTPGPTERTGSGTVVGENCVIMQYAHIGHDCKVGNRVLLSVRATLAGEVYVDDFAIISGLAAIHQFVSIGESVITGGCAKITQDAAPYTIIDGNPASLKGINIIGLKRRGFSDDDIRILKNLYRDLFYSKKKTWKEKLEECKEKYKDNEKSKKVFDFINENRRGLAGHHNHKG
ncbi:MAG: acyl-ACP--UDP-N-acetylglucosamine O-acyltransferase [Alphaproteobacteria bacterium]|nr:acyl-ACP--UDP-N-acetylglucosamine O-acyltransferase [Alphaproteobacteria bacterium]